MGSCYTAHEPVQEYIQSYIILMDEKFTSMVTLSWQYLRYLSNEVNFSSTKVTFDKHYAINDTLPGSTTGKIPTTDQRQYLINIFVDSCKLGTISHSKLKLRIILSMAVVLWEIDLSCSRSDAWRRVRVEQCQLTGHHSIKNRQRRKDLDH